MRPALLLLCALALLTAADPLCDPEKQYLLNGECCEMCKPGTRMASTGTCRSPECRECEENEYMERYNRESVCQRQPYCDPNLNFEFRGGAAVTRRHTCLCVAGFHCSSASCSVCAPHTPCGPGSGAAAAGGQTRDTVCEECPAGTFSNETSWNGTCHKMTVCASGYEAQQGSRESDNVCVWKHRHIGLVFAVLIPVLLAAAVALIIFFRWKGKTGHEPLNFMENGASSDIHHSDQSEEEEKTPIIASPTDDSDDSRDPLQETPSLRSLPHSHDPLRPSGPLQETPSLRSLPHSHDPLRPSGPVQETPSLRSLPEESEYDPSAPRALTENGKVLSQDGKGHVVSQEETQEVPRSQMR